MPGYRFCRTDDVPLLVDAYNACFAVHFDDVAPMVVDDFKRLTKDLDVWASSCMVAFDGDDPLGVLLSAKRDTSSLILAIGVRPDRQGRGLGRHLLTSLNQKLAILGPPDMTVEIPDADDRLRRFFASCDYRETGTFSDFEATGPPPESDDGAAELVSRVAAEELLDAGLFDDDGDRAWERAKATLVNRRDQLEGLAIASDVRVEAALLHRAAPGGGREVTALHAAKDASGDALLGILLTEVRRAHPGRVTIPKVAAPEIAPERLAPLGFARTASYAGAYSHAGSLVATS